MRRFPRCGCNTCILIDLGLIPSYHIRYFHHHFLDRLAIIIVLSDQTNKQPASGSIREILGAPTVFVILSTSDPAALLPSPTTPEATMILSSSSRLSFSHPPRLIPPAPPCLPRTLPFQSLPLFLLFSQKSLETMAPRQPTKSGKGEYTFIPPTYNERKYFTIITWLLEKTFTKQFVTHNLSLVWLFFYFIFNNMRIRVS